MIVDTFAITGCVGSFLASAISCRASFALWELMTEVLLEYIGGKPADDLHVVFAGGIHDALSASMVAALSASLAEKGVKVGVLLGSVMSALAGLGVLAVAGRRTAD